MQTLAPPDLSRRGPAGKIGHGKISYGKISYGKISYGPGARRETTAREPGLI